MRALLLGARDYYGREIRAFQIVPDQEHWTIDIPDMRRSWTAASEPIWRWHHAPWSVAIPPNAVAATTLASLRGVRVTQVARREDVRWELLAGDPDDVHRDDLRFVPLGTLLGADDTLFAIASLEDGAGVRRASPDAPWERCDPPPERRIPHTSAFICDCVFRHERKGGGRSPRLGFLAAPL
ncbi:MAG TPA: hypothetical protein VM261_10790 [Kofleriaceae bacterium]|nr:hypothetical protein [Kofleriaceae bacterium]